MARILLASDLDLCGHSLTVQCRMLLAHPILPLTIGSTTRNASYAGGSGTNTLTFRYTIQSADQDVDGITVDPASITGTITDAAGNAADFSSVPATSTVAVIVNPVIINSVTPSANDDYKEGDTIAADSELY